MAITRAAPLLTESLSISVHKSTFMNTLQLLKALPFTDAGIGGVYPADRVPWSWARPCAIIVNTDNHTQPGTHWVAIYLGSNGRGIYFDSFGMPPFDKRIAQRLRRNCRIYEYNEKRIQDISSNVCGQYCIVVLHWLFNNKSLRAFHKLFSSDTKRNDRIIIKMFKNITQKRKCNRKNLSKPFQNLSGKGLFHYNQYARSKFSVS